MVSVIRTMESPQLEVQELLTLDSSSQAYQNVVRWRASYVTQIRCVTVRNQTHLRSVYIATFAEMSSGYRKNEVSFAIGERLGQCVVGCKKKGFVGRNGGSGFFFL